MILKPRWQFFTSPNQFHAIVAHKMQLLKESASYFGNFNFCVRPKSETWPQTQIIRISAVFAAISVGRNRNCALVKKSESVCTYSASLG